MAEAREYWIPQAPSPALLLASYLARNLATKVALSSRENREKACQRAGLDPIATPKEIIDAELAQDLDYLVEQVLSAMTFVFVEVFGYILYKALSERVHDVGFALLGNGSMRSIKDTEDYENASKAIRTQNIEADDLAAIAWHSFRHVIDLLMAGPWKQAYQTARNRTRFNHSIETRRRIFKELDNLDQFLKKTQLTRPWAASIPSGQGLYDYFRKVIWTNP